MKKIKLKDNEVLVLRRNIEGNEAYGGFIYPQKGIVEAKDWINNKECGNGLHGWSLNNTSYFDENLKGNFIVLKVNKNDGYVELGDKVKLKKGEVILNTDNYQEAHDLMRSVYPDIIMHWSTANQGRNCTANQGNNSTANQWRNCTANQGNNSTANQKNNSTANQGADCTANQKNNSTANQWRNCTANQWNNSTANQWRNCTAKQGSNCTANQGNNSTANQGADCTANQWRNCTANQWRNCTAKQGDNSVSVVHGGSTIYRGGHLSILVMFNNGERYIYNRLGKGTTYYITGNKIIKKYKTTPEKINKLDEHEVFVFGSNLNGNHAGGAAKQALGMFGAVSGVAEGLNGQSYAFPTLDKNMQRVSEDCFNESIDKLIKCANNNTRKIFLVTKLGCGIAGFIEDEVINFFMAYKNKLSANIITPWDIVNYK